MKFEIPYKGEIYESEWFDSLNVDDKEVYSVAAFIFDEEKKLYLIKVKKSQGWTLPGGRVEKEDQSPEDALIREVEEEADIELKDIKRLGYFKTTCKGNPEYLTYNLKFIAKVDKVKTQTIDPAHNILAERILIDPEQFKKYVDWGDNGAFQLGRALDAIKK